MFRPLSLVLIALFVALAGTAATASAATHMQIGFYDDASFRWSPDAATNLQQAAVTGAPLRFSPDDRLLAGEVKGDQMRLREVTGGHEYRTLVHDPALGKWFYPCCAVSPDGRLLAVGTENGSGRTCGPRISWG